MSYSNSKIPKIIHYCWFGGNEKSELIKNCINSWKKYLPDYQIREWNDKDLTICNNQYVKEAYQEKIWAFVSDYFRLYALYNYGGIYFDTDNEVFKTLDCFLNLDFFAGIEERNKQFRPLFTGLLGAQKHNGLIKELLNQYNNLSLYDNEHNIIYISNTERFKRYLYKNYKIPHTLTDKTKIILKPNHIIFPSTYFCKYKKNFSYVMHHYSGSWSPNIREQKPIKLLSNFYLKIYAIKPECFWDELKQLKEVPILFYPRFKRYTVVITIGRTV